MAKILNLSELLLFQCKPNSKIPATSNGFKNAKINFDIKSCVANGFNVGLACEMSNIIVLDCDVDEARGLNGLKTLENLEKELGKLPNTLIQTTPRGGKHYFFSNKGITNPIGKICKDIDVKYNGYILIEPSKINSKAYKFIDGIDKNGEFIIADLPEKWVEFLNKPAHYIHKSLLSEAKESNQHQREIIDGDFQKMYERCAFIKHCVDNAETLSEPLWHLFACTMNSFSNGEELFDYYSQPHPDYNKTAVKTKFQNAAKYNVNCNTISGHFEDCAKCQYRKENATMENTINKPVQLSKKSITDLFNENENILKSSTLMSNPIPINFDDEEYDIPQENRFLHLQWNRVFSVTRKKNGLKVKLVTNFIVTDVKECTLVFNDRSGKNKQKNYIVTIQNSNGYKEKDIVIANNSKSDYKQFQNLLDLSSNNFYINMTEAEFKTFFMKYISPLVATKVTMYSNAGLTDKGFLYENALVTSEGVNWANDDGYIKTGENTYVKMTETTHFLPKLAKSAKTGKKVAEELILNIQECWGEDIALPMLTLGHMCMALFYNEFTKRYGAPTLILYGDTGTGKSTLVTVGLAIFGLSKEAMTSGGSTAKSNEYFCAKYNCCNVAIDDVKAETLMSSNFTTLIKGIYKGIPRSKMLPYGRGVEYIHTCSPLAYSTNEALPDLKEVINRLNVVEIFGKVFKADKFNYHELNKKNLDELSMILPEFLKYPIEKVINLYEKVFEILEKQVEDTQKRIINNLAYAYTGALLLKLIGGIEIKDLDKKVIEFAKKQVERYENIQTPVDRVLKEILIFNKLGVIQYDIHFRVMKAEYNGVKEHHLRFNQGVILTLINKYYAGDRNKNINEQSFLSYARNHSRFRDENHAVRYAKKNLMSSICFNVSDIEEYVNLNYKSDF